MCRKFITVTKENLPNVLTSIDKGKNCLLVNTRPTPNKIKHPLDAFGGCGYDLTIEKSKAAAKETLNGLMSIPENCGKVLCEIV